MKPKAMRVLICEPEALIAIDLERIVSETVDGAEIITDPEIAQAHRHGADLILCAVDHETCRARQMLEALSPPARIIVLSTRDDVAAGAMPWPSLPKPYLDRDLAAAIIALLRGS